MYPDLKIVVSRRERMKARAVIDTNVLVSSLIRPDGTAGILLRRLRDGAFTAVFSPAIIDELAAALVHPRIRTKYCLEERAFEPIAALFALRGEIAIPEESIRLCRDPDDNFLLETAVAGKADYIVSGDADLLDLRKFRTVKIVKPAAFLAILDKFCR